MAGEATKVPFIEAAAPSTPASGRVVVYAKADGLMYSKDDAGVETLMSGGATGAVATDAIWDAAGDLAVGSGANTAARLPIGAAGGALSRINGAVAWNSGTGFPTATTGDRYWRTDLALEFYYDGTRWLCTCPHHIQPMGYLAATDPGTASGDVRTFLNATGTGGGGRFPVPSLLGGSNLWLVDYTVTFQVAGGGSALSGSHKWVGTLTGLDSASASTGTAATTNVDSGSSSAFRRTTTTIGAAMAAGTLLYISGWTKTGTPGNIQLGEVLTYRVIAT